MIVMPSNNSKGLVHYWAGRYGHLGHLYSPGGQRGPYPWLPYGLDNGAFPAFAKGVPWNEQDYIELIDWAWEAPMKPLWSLVPDVVCDRELTVESWYRWYPRLRGAPWPLAFAVQDGMTKADVPKEAGVIFVGGSTEWKWANVERWCAEFPRVHVGRVNTHRLLEICDRAGAESCDGTGWMRGDPDQLEGLERWLQKASGVNLPMTPLSMCSGVSRSRMGRGSKSSGTAASDACGAG